MQYMSNSNLIALIVLMSLIILILLFIIGSTLYALQGVGLTKIARREGKKNIWISWIPYLNFFSIVDIAFNNKYIKYTTLSLLLLSIVIPVMNINNISYIKIDGVCFYTVVLTLGILILLSLLTIYKKYSKKYILMFVITVLSCGVMAPVFIFAIRNNETKIDKSSIKISKKD